MKRTPQTAGVHVGCHNCQSEPAKPQPASGGERECCKALQSLPAEPVKAEAKYDASLFALLDFALKAVAAQPVVTSDTGPPRALSFAERILQRSVLSHAPPCFV